MPQAIKLFDVNSQGTLVVDGQPVPNEIVELYENYDKSFADWCSFHVKKESNGSLARVPTIFATPDRAFSQYGKTLEEKYSKNPNSERVPLPFISIARSNFVYDPKRFQSAKIRKRFLSRDRRKWVGGNYPMPVNITYDIDLWSKTLRTCDLIRLELMRKFCRTGLVVLHVYHPVPVGIQKVIMRQISFTDNTPLEFGTTDERALRHSYSFEIEGWLTYPYEITPSVLKTFIEYGVENADGSVEIDHESVYENTTEENFQEHFKDDLGGNPTGIVR